MNTQQKTIEEQINELIAKHTKINDVYAEINKDTAELHEYALKQMGASHEQILVPQPKTNPFNGF